MNPNQNIPGQKKPCFSFIKSGTCKFGDSCRFGHSIPANAMIRQKNSLDQVKPKPQFQSSTKPPCRFFAQGTCKNGDSCRFSHSPQTGQQGKGPGQGQQQGYQKPPYQKTPYQKPQGYQGGQQGGQGNYQGGQQGYKKPYQGGQQNYQGGYQGNQGNQGGQGYNRGQKNFVRDYKNEKPEASSNFLRHVYTNDDVYGLNNLRRVNNSKSDFKIPELLFNKCALFDNKIIIMIKGKNFILEFDFVKKEYGKRQKYVNSEIDESILDIKIGKFGNIESEFSAIAYTKFNELNLTMRCVNKFWSNNNT